jgi:hypothetical protein
MSLSIDFEFILSKSAKNIKNKYMHKYKHDIIFFKKIY